MPANLPRFRFIGRIGNVFVVFDTATLKPFEFETRSEAEQDCDSRNGVFRPKTSEPAELSVLREKLRRERCLSVDDQEALDNPPRVIDLLPTRRPIDRRIIVDHWKTILPKCLHAWAGELARQSGLDDAERRMMDIDEIVSRIASNKEIYFRNPALQFLDDRLSPILWGRLEDEGFRGVLAVHYLSSEPSHLKAKYLGLSKRSYYRQLDAGHKSLTESLERRFRRLNDADPRSIEHIERDHAYPGHMPSDDDDGGGGGRARHPSEGFWHSIRSDDVDSGGFDR